MVLKWIHMNLRLIANKQLHWHFKKVSRNFLTVQWLGLNPFTAEGPGSIPHRGIKILQTTWCSQKRTISFPPLCPLRAPSLQSLVFIFRSYLCKDKQNKWQCMFLFFLLIFEIKNILYTLFCTKTYSLKNLSCGHFHTRILSAPSFRAV